MASIVVEARKLLESWEAILNFSGKAPNEAADLSASITQLSTILESIAERHNGSMGDIFAYHAAIEQAENFINHIRNIFTDASLVSMLKSGITYSEVSKREISREIDDGIDKFGKLATSVIAEITAKAKKKAGDDVNKLLQAIRDEPGLLIEIHQSFKNYPESTNFVLHLFGVLLHKQLVDPESILDSLDLIKHDVITRGNNSNIKYVAPNPMQRCMRVMVPTSDWMPLTELLESIPATLDECHIVDKTTIAPVRYDLKLLIDEAYIKEKGLVTTNETGISRTKLQRYTTIITGSAVQDASVNVPVSGTNAKYIIETNDGQHFRRVIGGLDAPGPVMRKLRKLIHQHDVGVFTGAEIEVITGPPTQFWESYNAHMEDAIFAHMSTPIKLENIPPFEDVQRAQRLVNRIIRYATPVVEKKINSLGKKGVDHLLNTKFYQRIVSIITVFMFDLLEIGDPRLRSELMLSYLMKLNSILGEVRKEFVKLKGPLSGKIKRLLEQEYKTQAVEVVLDEIEKIALKVIVNKMSLINTIRTRAGILAEVY